MKITLITDVSLPGAFLVESESKEEALIIRMFCDDKRPINTANHSGNMDSTRSTMLIMHYGDKQSNEK